MTEEGKRPILDFAESMWQLTRFTGISHDDLKTVCDGILRLAEFPEMKEGEGAQGICKQENEAFYTESEKEAVGFHFCEYCTRAEAHERAGAVSSGDTRLVFAHGHQI